jgi:UDP-glucose 4-epimerase
VTGPSRRVLVTGGAGFIGVHTVARLVEQGWDVLVIDDLRHACGEPLPAGVHLDAVDVSSPAANATVQRFRPDAILHLAAQGGVSRSMRDPAADAIVNVVGTVAVLKAAVDAGCRRVVMASSGGAIYGQAARLPAPERTEPRPRSAYGAAKLAAEGYLEMFGRTFELSPLALRYSNVYGPHQDGTGEAGVVAITCERLLSDRPPEIRGDGDQTRDFVFVDDVAEANVRGLTSRAEGSFNIGTGIATSVRTVVEELIDLAAYQGPITFVDERPGEVRHTRLAISRAAARMGWTPRTGLRDGLRQTFISFQQRTGPSRAPAIAAPGEVAATGGPGSPSKSG